MFSQVCVCSTFGVGGYPISGLDGGYPISGLDGGWRGTPSEVQVGGYHIPGPGGGGYPIPDLDGGGTPSQVWEGPHPRSGLGVPRVPPVQDWMGYPCPRLDGKPPCPDPLPPFKIGCGRSFRSSNGEGLWYD